MTPSPDPTIKFGRRGRLAIIVGFVLLILAGVATLAVASLSERQAAAAAHSREIRETLALLFREVQDAEGAERGYLLTGDRSDLDAVRRAEARTPGLQSRLAALAVDNARLRGAVATFLADVDREMAALRRASALGASGDVAGAVASIRTDEARDLAARIRARSRTLDEAQARNFDAARTEASVQRTVVRDAIAVTLLIMALLALVVWLEIRRYITELSERYASLQREVAQRERAEEQLRQSQKMEALGQLTGGIAHDFNNMLAIIIGNLDMMIRRLPAGDERVRAMADNALAGATRAASLTRRLLAFSRRQALDPRATDVNRCVADMSQMLRDLLGGAVAVETILAGGLWRAFVDRPQLESAILNLAVNARDAMAEAGRLTLETANASLDHSYAARHTDVEPGQYVMVAVTDTGGGMSAETMERAFDPFFTTKKAGEGTGLGLSQVHGFIKQSRGHIALYSEPGVGTTVKLYLPRDLTGKPEPQAQAEHAVRRDNSGFTVLVVEDNPGVRGFVVSAARELGYRVVEADSAVVALERVRETPDLSVLLTDLVMPAMNGRQLADSVLALRPGLPVVFMTGYTRNAIVHNGTLDGGVRLLTKPFTVADLERELAQACRRPIVDDSAGSVN
jgi:signal transduction histidine kinase/ActR/RegA family two-component response regulator